MFVTNNNRASGGFGRSSSDSRWHSLLSWFQHVTNPDVMMTDECLYPIFSLICAILMSGIRGKKGAEELARLIIMTDYESCPSEESGVQLSFGQSDRKTITQTNSGRSDFQADDIWSRRQVLWSVRILWPLICHEVPDVIFIPSWSSITIIISSRRRNVILSSVVVCILPAVGS